MVKIGGKPILWHIMKIFSTQGINEFIIALGYKSEYIKDYFINAHVRNHDLTVDLATGETRIHEGYQDKWLVHLVDTGLYTQTGGRLKRLRDWLAPNETFFSLTAMAWPTSMSKCCCIFIKRMASWHP